MGKKHEPGRTAAFYDHEPNSWKNTANKSWKQGRIPQTKANRVTS
jgi:hypothetical protein